MEARGRDSGGGATPTPSRACARYPAPCKGGARSHDTTPWWAATHCEGCAAATRLYGVEQKKDPTTHHEYTEKGPLSKEMVVGREEVHYPLQKETVAVRKGEWGEDLS